MTDPELQKMIEALPYYCGRGQCLAVLRAAGGMGEDAMREGMKLLAKTFPLGCKRAKYVRSVFLAAFKLPHPGGSKS